VSRPSVPKLTVVLAHLMLCQLGVVVYYTGYACSRAVIGNDEIVDHEIFRKRDRIKDYGIEGKGSGKDNLLSTEIITHLSESCGCLAPGFAKPAGSFAFPN
jgi:hypothetical protein